MALDEFKKNSIIRPLLKYGEMTYKDLKEETGFWDERLSNYIRELEDEGLIKSRMNRSDRRSRIYCLGTESYSHKDVQAGLLGSAIYLDIMVGLNPELYKWSEIPSLKKEPNDELDSLALQLGRLALWSISKSDLEKRTFLRTYKVLSDTRFSIPKYKDIIKSSWCVELDRFKQKELESISERKLLEIRKALEDFETKKHGK